MFKELKAVLEFINQHQVTRFSDVFRKVPLALGSYDRDRLKTYMIKDELVYNFHGEGNEFGSEAHYALTASGKELHKRLLESEYLDKILKFLSDNSKSFFYSTELCEKLNIPYSKSYELRLISENMVEANHSVKEGRLYKITDAGENWILVKGGYTQVLSLLIEEGVFEHSTPKKEQKDEPTQHTVNYNYHNVGSTITYQGNEGTVNEPVKKEEKKNSWLQNVYWIIGILVALTALYTFVKTLLG